MISSDGKLVTAHHVVADIVEKGNKGFIQMQNGNKYPIIPKRGTQCYWQDTATLQVEIQDDKLQPLKALINYYCNLNEGQDITVQGFHRGKLYRSSDIITKPKSYDFVNNTLTEGMFETSAPGMIGQSGGPITDSNGALIGINSLHNGKKEDNIGLITGAKNSSVRQHIPLDHLKIQL